MYNLLANTETVITIVVVLAVLLIIFFSASVKIVRQGTTVIVERLGKYHKTLDTGFHIILPFFDKAKPPISLKERVADFPPQPIITKDNVTMKIDTVVYFQVTDPKLYLYGVERPISAIENLTATTLRNIVGELELDATLTSRDTVNVRMRQILDEATDAWGIKVNRVELKNIDPPAAIRDAMEKQMRAERERREAILLAEGEKKSSILRAEGEKQSTILRAEAQKEAEILKAEAKKASLIAEAEGQAQAIKKIIEAEPDKAYITLQSLEALKAVADGKATKIIIPSEIQNVASLVASVKEVADTDKPE
ncbi:MAG: SPFH/Band 7/PHB domain protein [Clostridia bacterium]|nr:SPFH/Band 7/PHB domain protein [Clostridia bacterium]